MTDYEDSYLGDSDQVDADRAKYGPLPLEVPPPDNTGVHVCHGDPECCETPAVCTECGQVASPTTPIHVWFDPDQTENFLCPSHIRPLSS